MGLVVILLSTVVVLFEPLFLDVSLLSVDHRLVPPWVSLAPHDGRLAALNPLGADADGWIVPATMLAARALERGEWPLWNPYLCLGQPLWQSLAIPAPYASLPLTLLFGAIRGYALTLALHVALLGVGSYLFLRRRGLHALAAVFGALAAMWSGFVTAHVHLPHFVETLAYLPWLLLAIEEVCVRASLRAGAWLALACGFSLLAGFPQLGFAQIAVALAHGLWHRRLAGGRGPILRVTMIAGLGLVVGLAIAAVVLLPGRELLASSARREPLSRARLCAKALTAPQLAGLVLRGRATGPVVIAGAALLAIAACWWVAARHGRTRERLLRDYEALADATRAQRLLQRADRDLWPAHPDKLQAMIVWQAEAGPLAARRESHERALEEMCRSAAAGSQPPSFASAEEQWLHDRREEVILELDRLVAAQADVQRRIALAQRLAVEGDRARPLWRRAIASIADPAECPAYRGLAITEQVGVVPIGRDPGSGLWEFTHLASGVPPVRDAAGILELTDDSGLVLVLLPGGSFEMGAMRPTADHPIGAPNVDPDAYEGESPVHRVSLDPFFIAKHEMTQGQWLRAAGENPSTYGPDVRYGEVQHSLRHPVERVSWEDARRTLFQLGLGLPTEAQWEYAARAGTSTPWSSGLERESLRGAANLADRSAARGGANWGPIADWPDLDDGYGVHSPVGHFRPNAFGLHDVHGNLWEWCLDGYESYTAPVRAGDGYRGEGKTRDRIARGGSYNFAAADARSANRGKDPLETRSSVVGVRPARPLDR